MSVSTRVFIIFNSLPCGTQPVSMCVQGEQSLSRFLVLDDDDNGDTDMTPWSENSSSSSGQTEVLTAHTVSEHLRCVVLTLQHCALDGGRENNL